MNKVTMIEELWGEFGTMEEAAQYFQTSREILYQSLNGK
ncbi:hypothetical protein BegalDRAFT_0955 [Beggiatoa alba B18LD]|uniref:Uncharacterized protein n=1 Tax=Beggiatoa alba B18LD TaxID=395493 RepID=I3CE18_9GAMM|nr:hypothetical protein BegalDRAFT_0955 [Beggiatoa alba B18LD]